MLRSNGPGPSHSRPKEDGPTSALRDYGADEALEVWLRILRATGSRYLFPSRLHARPHSTRQYSRLDRWVDSIGLKSIFYGTHSMRRTKVTQIYRKTGNLRAVQLLLGTATYCPRTTG